MRTRGLLTAAATAVLVAAVTACGSSPPPKSSSAIPISFNDASCGGAWHLASPGWHTFEITSGAENGAEVDLTNPANGAVYDELEDIGPGTTAPMSLDVGSGQVRVPLPGAGLRPGHRAYGHCRRACGGRARHTARHVQRSLPAGQGVRDSTPSRDCRSSPNRPRGWRPTCAAGKLAAAKRDWLAAHLQYETLGAAYDAFGNFDDEIDGRADAVGINSPKWTGFYRLEYGLWHGQSVRELPCLVANTLNLMCTSFSPGGRRSRSRCIDIGLRTHEILENALRVPAHRPRRLRQRHHPRHHPRQHSGHPVSAVAAAPAARAALPAAARGLHGAEPPAVADGEGAPPGRAVGARLRPSCGHPCSR